MHFCDEAIIKVKSGNGGNGCMSFRREKYVPKGGPDGGNGGRGGSIIFEGDENQNTLSDYLSQKHFQADKGRQGGGQNMAGRDGEDLVLKVPLGTVITDAVLGKPVADIKYQGERIVVAPGGRGGKGNANFKSSTRQAPDFAELGEPGKEMELRLELKLIAEIAIIGYPSVGKSSLISRISNARPKIADYPFTTLVPNLGTVKVDDTDFVVADIPGLIEGAHEGKGLGIAFLKHIERTKFLVHLMDITHDNLKEEYKILNQELKLYSPALAKKPQLLVFNKVDATIPEILDDIKKQFKTKKPLFVSVVSGEGIQAFLYRLKEEVLKMRKKEKAKKPKVTLEPKVFRPHLDLPNIRNYEVIKESDGVFKVSGDRIEQIARMTDPSMPGAVVRVFDILKKIGAQKELDQLGVIEGDKIKIADREFEFYRLQGK